MQTEKFNDIVKYSLDKIGDILNKNTEFNLNNLELIYLEIKKYD